MNISYTKFPDGFGLNLIDDLKPNVTYLCEHIHTEGNLTETEILNICDNHVPTGTYVYAFFPQDMITAAKLLNYLMPNYAITNVQITTEPVLLFFTSKPDMLALRSDLLNYQEPAETTSVFFEKNNNLIKSDTGDLFYALQPDEVVVSKNAGTHTTITAALQYVNTLLNKAVIIRVFPGTYLETETIALPASACLTGEGSAGNTVIVGMHTGPVITTGDFNVVKNLHIMGGSVGIAHNGANSAAFTLMKDCLIKQPTLTNSREELQGNAIYVYGGMGSLVLAHVSIYADALNENAWYGPAIHVKNSSLIMSETIIQAQCESGILLDNVTLSIDITSIYYCQAALKVKNKSRIKGTLVNVINCYAGLHLAANDTSFNESDLTRISINYLHLDNCTKDIISAEKAILEIYSGHININKIQEDIPIDLSGIFSNIYDGKLHQIITGENFIKGSLNFGLEKYNHNRYVSELGTVYISDNAKIYHFDTENDIAEIYAYTATNNWNPVKFVKKNDDYWLDLNYASDLLTLDGISAHWLKLGPTSVQNTFDKKFEFYEDCISIETANLRFLGAARRKCTIYLDCTLGVKCFYLQADTSTACEIVLAFEAETVCTINSQTADLVTDTTAYVYSKKQHFENGLQKITVTANNTPVMIAVHYYVLEL